MATSDRYIVTTGNIALPVAKLLERRSLLGRRVPPPSNHRDPLPVTPDGEVEPGVLYPADGGVQYYLPKYKVRQAPRGRFDVALVFEPEPESEDDDAPTVSVGTLKIGLSWVIQEAVGAEVRVIDHLATAHLVYRLPVEGGAAGMREEIALGALERSRRRKATVSHQIPDKVAFDRIYKAMTDARFQAKIEIRSRSTIGRKTWNQIVVGTVDADAQVHALARGALYSSILNAKTLALIQNAKVLEKASTSVTTVEDPEEDARVDTVKSKLPLALATHAAGRRSDILRLSRINPTILASIATSHARRPPPSVQPQPPPTFTPVSRFVRPGVILSALHAEEAQPAADPSAPIRHLSPAAMTALLEATRAREVVLARPEPVQPALLQPAVLLAAMPVDRSARMATLERAWAPDLTKIVATSDLRIARFDKPVVPLRAVTDDKGEPALIQIEVESEQALAFLFEVETNGYVYDFPDDLVGDAQDHHLLVPMQIFDGGELVATAYRDLSDGDAVYLPPSGFRLRRDDEAPHLPQMSVLFYDVVGEGEGSSVEIHYRVEIVVQLRAYFRGNLDTLVRAHLPDGAVPTFKPIAPVSASLSLDLPNEAGEFVSTPRPNARIKLGGSVLDTIELSSTEYNHLFATFHATTGDGVTGSVDFQMFDGTTHAIPVALSLRKAMGETVHTQLMGPTDEPGHYTVAVRNRIESPIEIGGASAVQIGDHAVAFLNTDPATLGVLRPQESARLEFRVEPADAMVTELDPDVQTQVHLDLPALYPMLFVNKGFTSETFTVQVAAVEGTFAPREGEPLIGLLVAFEGDTSVTLTADTPSEEVVLRMGLLRRLLGLPESMDYRFRVTNLHPGGEGARTAWQTVSGDLDVTSA